MKEPAMPQPSAAPSSATTSRVVAGRGHAPRHSLLIEPDTDMRLTLELALSVHGQTVTIGEDEASARAALSNERYSLIVMNRVLPDADALAFCGEARALDGGAQATIVVIAADASEDDRAAALAAGADDYIGWPVDAEELQARLDTAERRASRRGQAERAARSTDAPGELFLVVDADGAIRRAGEVAERLLGFPPETLPGVNAFSFFHPDDAPRLLALLVEALTRQGPSRAVELRVRRDGDSWRAVTMSLSNQLADSELRGIAFHLREPDSRAQVVDQAAHAAMHDRVTDLPNRSLFIDRIDHAVARATRRNQPVVVMVVDFNDYAPADGTPREVSDGLIVALAERVRSCLRASDTAARLGHDEFGLLLEEVADLDHTAIVANRIIQAMTVPFSEGGEEIELRPNIGVAFTTPESFRAADLLRDANIARAWARVQGSGRFVMFDPSMSAPDGDPLAEQDTAGVQQLQPSLPVAPAPDDRIGELSERIASLEQTMLRLETLVGRLAR